MFVHPHVCDKKPSSHFITTMCKDNLLALGRLSLSKFVAKCTFGGIKVDNGRVRESPASPMNDTRDANCGRLDSCYFSIVHGRFFFFFSLAEGSVDTRALCCMMIKATARMFPIMDMHL